MKIDELIDYLLDNSHELVTRLAELKELRFKVATNDEFERITLRIEVLEALLGV